MKTICEKIQNEALVNVLKPDVGNLLKEENHQIWKTGLEIEMVESKVTEFLELL